MKSSVKLIGLCAFLVCCTKTFGTVEDSVITADAKEYDRLFSQARESGDRPGMADMGDYSDKAFANLPVNELTLDQVVLMMNSAPIRLSTKTSAALNAYLDTIATGTDETAARAQLYKLDLLPPTIKPADLVKPLTAALTHKGIKEAIAGGRGGELFATGGELGADQLLALRASYLDLKDAIKPTGRAPLFIQGAMFFMSIPHVLNGKDLASFASLREAFSSALQEKLNTISADDKTRPGLERALAQLNGAYARGELIGHKAPPLEFAWFKDPANPDKTIHSLDDLKGKVVVLDFWATWCGPCVASFPKVKALAHYYRGYDVVVLSVTSLQGFVYSSKGRLDTANDPEKEYKLTDDFLKEHDVNWPVAFSKQPVFNPDYGVMGIPDVIMIDPDGIVRQAGLHPAVPLEEKTALVDELLSEAHHVIPATLLEMKKPETPQ
ncbi:MAG TPA: TlpA disulfide reductase family protein [Phycisphaerae bacterium]|nr:TlpA disulfide reductase family protein [Phycisphaerae bacterium]